MKRVIENRKKRKDVSIMGQDFVNFALNPDNDGVIIEKLRRRSLLADTRTLS